MPTCEGHQKKINICNVICEKVLWLSNGKEERQQKTTEICSSNLQKKKKILCLPTCKEGHRRKPHGTIGM